MELINYEELENPFPSRKTYKATYDISGEIIEQAFTFEKQDGEWNLIAIYPGANSTYLNKMKQLLWKKIRVRLIYE